jgi:hypothetical protein
MFDDDNKKKSENLVFFFVLNITRALNFNGFHDFRKL